jgi:hypothetical protein
MSRRMIAPGKWEDEGPSSFNAKPWAWASSGTHVGSERPRQRTLDEARQDRYYEMLRSAKFDDPDEHRKAQQRQWTQTHRERHPRPPRPARQHEEYCYRVARHRGACTPQPAPRALCGRRLNNKTAPRACARKLGHAGYPTDCASRESMDNMNAWRRTREAAA